MGEWKFTPRSNLTLHCLFGYFGCVYVKKHVTAPFLIQFTQIRLPYKNILSRTSIEGEAQEELGAWMFMGSATSFRGFFYIKVW